MHPLLGWPYDLAASAAELLAHSPLSRGASKPSASLRARRDLLGRYRAWGTSHRDPARPLVWLHAPSVGEGLQARPVIELLRRRRPEAQVAYTFFSPSAERFASSLGADFTDYLPFDRLGSMRAALDALRPSALVFVKLDLWPRLVQAACERGIPVAMVSATLPEASARNRPLARALLGDAYQQLRAVGAIDTDDASRLVTLGVPRERISVTGDTRYDQVAARAAAADTSRPPLASLIAARPTLVAGSTWPADEEPLLAAWLAVRRDVPDARTLRLFLAAHEPSDAHTARMLAWARTNGLSAAPFAAADATHDVIVVDVMGVLGDLYALADVAFVGGGFHGAGLHSVLEPAAFGSPVLFGPSHGNSRDASLLLRNGGGVSAADGRELASALRTLFADGYARARAAKAARSLVAEGQGAADRAFALVAGLLAPE